MTKLQDMVPAEMTKGLEEELFKEAGFHGSVTGSIVRHDDEELTVDFFEVQDADGEELEDENRAYSIGLVLSEQCFSQMLTIAKYYPDLVDIELEVTF